MSASESRPQLADAAQLPSKESVLVAAKRALRMIAAGASLKDILEHLCLAMDAQNPLMMSTVLLADADGCWLRPAAGPRVPAAWPGSTSPVIIGPDVGSCGAAAFSKERVITSDIASDPRWSGEPPRPSGKLAVAHGIQSSWSEPLLSSSHEALGTFCMYYGQPRTPSRSEIQLIEDAGQIAVIAIEGERAQTALKRAFVEIEESAHRLRTILDAIPAQAYRLRADGAADYFNQRWHDYTGISRQASQLSGRQGEPLATELIRATVHPQDAERVIAQWRDEILAARAGGELEYRLRRADGQYRWFIARIEPMRDERGTLVGWCGTNTDIEDLKRAEHQLREDEQELRRIADVIPQMIAVLSPGGVPVYANRALLEYTGLTASAVMDPNLHARIAHPEEVTSLRELRREGFARAIPFETEERTRRHDGVYRWFLVRHNPLRDEHGRVLRWYATGTDIDERKRGEERTRKENLALREDIDHSSMFEEIVGSSLQPVLVQVAKVAETDSTVLVLGETGTGKELIARAIHKRSSRATRAFIRVNCAAIPPALVASELFGHEKGAFTGALQRRLGRFEAADGGTIFLDEIGDLPPETQVALLRVLQEQEFERVGSTHPVRVDVRVLAATNRDLEAAVEQGSFRQDLYYRLNVFPIRIPPLRERVEDIPVLVEYLVERYAKKAGKRIRTIQKQTLDLFRAYDWPGNVRELQNVIERAVVLCEGQTFAIEESWLKRRPSKPTKHAAHLVSSLAERERALIESALSEAKGKISGPSGAAAKLGIPRQTLESKIKALRLDKLAFRAR